MKTPEESSFNISDWIPAIGGPTAGAFIIIVVITVWILHKKAGAQSGSQGAMTPITVTTVVTNNGDT